MRNVIILKKKLFSFFNIFYKNVNSLENAFDISLDLVILMIYIKYLNFFFLGIQKIIILMNNFFKFIDCINNI